MDGEQQEGSVLPADNNIGQWILQQPQRRLHDNANATSSQKQESVESKRVEKDSGLPSPAPSPYPGVQPSLDIAVEAARVKVQRQLGLCRHLIITLELTRMRQSRMGSYEWFELWHKVYTDRVCIRLCRRVADTLRIIARLFFYTVRKLCALIGETERRTEAATSVEEIDKLVDEMSECGRRYCDERRERTTNILDAMRRDFVMVPIDITDKIFIEVKRDMFGVDVHGNYYPYDKPPRRHGDRINTELDATLFAMEEPELPAHDGFTPEFQSDLEAAVLQLANYQSIPHQRRGGLSIEVPMLIRALEARSAGS